MSVITEEQQISLSREQKSRVTEEAFYVNVGNTEWAIAQKSVYSILSHADISELPKQPPHIVGMLAYQGLCLPVVDLTILFNLNMGRKFGSFVLILKHGQTRFAVLVDSLIMQESLITDATSNALLWQDTPFSQYVKALAQFSDQHYFVLDVEKLRERLFSRANEHG